MEAGVEHAVLSDQQRVLHVERLVHHHVNHDRLALANDLKLQDPSRELLKWKLILPAVPFKVHCKEV